MGHLALINVNGSTVKDVPAKDFIRSFAEHLKRKNLVKMPEWAQYVKTAAWKELAPYESDWLYTRCCLRHVPTLHQKKDRRYGQNCLPDLQELQSHPLRCPLTTTIEGGVRRPGMSSLPMTNAQSSRACNGAP